MAHKIYCFFLLKIGFTIYIFVRIQFEENISTRFAVFSLKNNLQIPKAAKLHTIDVGFYLLFSCRNFNEFGRHKKLVFECKLISKISKCKTKTRQFKFCDFPHL